MRVMLITDLDNTLYNWVDFFGTSFRAMIHALARQTKVEETVLYSDFQTVYKRYATIEYAFTVQELDCFRHLSLEKRDELANLAQRVFRRTRENHLKLYPEVRETLEWARNSGVLVFGVTNAYAHHATMRLRQLHIDRLFTGLVAREDELIPGNSERTRKIQEKKAQGAFSSPYFKAWSLPASKLKPNPNAYALVLNHYVVDPNQTYVIGDSINNDLVPARQLGCNTILATYGQQHKPKNMETLLAITSWVPAQTAAYLTGAAVEPDERIKSFAELREIIRVPQQQLAFK